MNVFVFSENPSICPAPSLKEYLARRAQLWQTNAKSMSVAITKPFKCVTSQTIGRCIKQLRADDGINTNMFKYHNIHSASAAWIGKTKEMSVAEICKAGSWSAKSTTIGNSTAELSSKLGGSRINSLVCRLGGGGQKVVTKQLPIQIAICNFWQKSLYTSLSRWRLMSLLVSSEPFPLGNCDLSELYLSWISKITTDLDLDETFYGKEENPLGSCDKFSNQVESFPHLSRSIFFLCLH